MLSTCLVPLNCMVELENVTLGTVYHSFEAIFHETSKEIRNVDQ